METLGDLVARDRRSDHTALRADAADRALTYHDFCTTAWKAGNYLRYLGVGPGDRVAVADDGLPEPVLAVLGAGLLGAVVSVGVDEYAGRDGDGAGTEDGGRGGDGVENADGSPDGTPAPPRVVVAPVAREAEFDLPGGSRLLTYGGVPERPRTAHWEGDVWSENPAFPPVDVDPSSPALWDAGAPDGEGGSYSHAEVLGAAAAVVKAHDLDAETDVAVRGSLRRPAVVVAGVVAPLLAGGTVVFPAADTVCDARIGDGGPESTAVDPARVL
ncbi:MAG: AMP-binding protein [Haloferacaceae archaeon]